MADSRPETRKHIKRVAVLLRGVASDLKLRAVWHDGSKLERPEREVFDEFTPKLKGCTYGSDEYKGYLGAMAPALKHHYAMNRHHPEHFDKGVSGMTLADLCEMLCDWKAASERHADGNIQRSITLNAERFGLSGALVEILRNTAQDWESEKPCRE